MSADFDVQTTQAGDALRDLLARMGAAVSRQDDVLTVRGTGAILGIEADLRAVTELATVIAALAALAEGPSHLTGPLPHSPRAPFVSSRVSTASKVSSATGSRSTLMVNG